MKRHATSGFTLVEIALALLVTSIGLMGMFSLLPAGVQMNRDAINETRAAMFAEQVLNGIRAQASIQRWDIVNNNIRLPPPSPHIWANPNDLYVQPWEGTDPKPLKFQTAGALGGGGESYVDYTIRYWLRILDLNEPDDPTAKRRKGVWLRVLPGEYGATSNAYTFYTEIYNYGQQ